VATHCTDEAVLSSSPLGKIPFIRTPQGSMCESHAILEYIEAAYPTPALLPADPFAAAKVRELMTFIDMHLELVARELYPQAFFGGTVSESTQATKAVYGEDLLQAGGVDYKAYVKFIGERLTAQKVAADRKTASTKA
jgi:glutathione S-transferase